MVRAGVERMMGRAPCGRPGGLSIQKSDAHPLEKDRRVLSMPNEITTEVIRVNALQPEASIIDYAADLLRAANIVAFPTETVYGLGADVFQPAALERIFVAKERPHSHPLIAHIADEASLELLTTAISEQAKRLATVFWPGPLTLILPPGPRVPHLVTPGLQTLPL